MSGQLRRDLGVNDAVVVGAGSMIGAGVFSAWSPASEAAGTGVLFALALAAAVAFCNATSSAQLAALYPESGGTYVYARHRLGPVWGYLAGWGFVVGKTASCVAIALTAGAYLWPEHHRLAGVGAMVAVTLVNLGGLTRTVTVTKWLLVVALAALVAVVIAGWSSPDASLERITPIDTSVTGVLRAAGFLFFAFAGYARIATLGEEVRDPAVTIPKAIPRALAGVLVVYTIVGVTLLAAVPIARIAASGAPLGLVVSSSPAHGLAPLVRIGTGVAALGVLLNLVPGVSRTILAMARRRELPPWFAVVDERRSSPLRAQAVVTIIVISLTAAIDLRGAIGFSGVAILTYYALANASSWTLPEIDRRWPRWLSAAGFVGCVALAVMLPLASVLSGAAVLMLGLVVHAARAPSRHDPPEP